MGHSGRRNADEELAALLAAGLTVRDAARRAGVAERTAHRRRGEPAFQARVAEHQARLLEAAAGRLADGMGRAADELVRLLDDPSPGVRLRAAAKLLEVGPKVVESAALGRRVAALEAQALAEPPPDPAPPPGGPWPRAALPPGAGPGAAG